LIDDENGRTLAAASSEQIKTKAAKRDISIEVGKVIAGKAKDKGITSIVFDRGGYRYMGRVKALADACREAGLQF
jgi:large subunit ribosomal protein L18